MEPKWRESQKRELKDVISLLSKPPSKTQTRISKERIESADSWGYKVLHHKKMNLKREN